MSVQSLKWIRFRIVSTFWVADGKSWINLHKISIYVVIFSDLKKKRKKLKFGIAVQFQLRIQIEKKQSTENSNKKKKKMIF